MAEHELAIVGMACRLPGASDLQAFWRMLREGRDARRELSDEHLRSVGVPDDVLADPGFVKAAMLLDDIDRFDAGFFGMSPRDAALFDPQHRVWLEVCWEAFENAGHVPERFGGPIGVFAGCGMDTYLLNNILSNPDLVRQIGMFLIRHTGNDKDFLATRTSYQFDLRGPSINVITACSTSLVAIHQAANSLLAGECDMALAGGVTILVPQDHGYLYKEGEVLSPDGHCRSFDAGSKGTIFGSGAGVVLLRRLQDAIDDGDHIHAVIAGSAVNNDGSRKVSYLAPSVDGYAEVVAEALALADVEAERVQYVEAHGTGTSVGDPIEIEALTQAFRATTGKSQFCGIGSVKTNIGHLDTAAGVAGVLKVALAMQHGELPASLNYRRPNPLIDFPSTPFRVVSEHAEWPSPESGPRIAGVSSLGVGGTNGHVILREAVERPAPVTTPYPRRCQLVPISGKAKDAVRDNAARLANWLGEHGDQDLADVAGTMQTGRSAFAHRAFAVGADAAELQQALTSDDLRALVRKAPDRAPSVVFLFPGGGAQYPGMGKELYAHEPAFRAAADECFAALPERVRGDVEALLFGDAATPEHAERMARGSLLLTSLFVVEYSLAMTLRSFGIEPDAMLGHSLGEYVAGTLGGTWTLDQVLPVLVLRGECLEAAPSGHVLSVSLPAAEVLAMGDADLSVSAANAPELCAVAGPPDAIERFEQTLQQRDVDFQRLRIGAGAHSHLLDPVLDRFREGLRQFRLQPANKPWVSNVTGDWIDPQRAADPDYWVEHLRRTVRFEDCVGKLLDGGDRLFVEVGPGKALTSLVRMHERARKSGAVVSVPHPKDERASDAFLLDAIGRMWQHGVDVDWRAFQGGVQRRRVPLPTYAFQRERHWIDAGRTLLSDGPASSGGDAPPMRLPDAQWLQQPRWRAQPLAGAAPANDATWLCVGRDAFVDAFAQRVRSQGGTAHVLRDVDEAALVTIAAAGDRPDRVLFADALHEPDAAALVRRYVQAVQALANADLIEELRIVALTSGAQRVADEAVRSFGAAALAGVARVVPREFAGVRALCVDADDAARKDAAALADALCREVEADGDVSLVALRGAARHVQEWATLPSPDAVASPWRERGSYLITGGLGGIGMLLAEHLARRCKAKLSLLSRSGLPPRSLWNDWTALRVGDRTATLIGRIRAMEQAGAEVEVFAADVADERAMQSVAQKVVARRGGLHGVVHAAGVLDDGPLQLRTPEQIDRMLRPKVQGAVVLDAVTKDIAPETFVVFGSTSGVAGIPGQCDYAAANAALDAFAEWRSRARAGRTLAVDWGIWQDAGMLAANGGMTLPAPTWLGARRDVGGGAEFSALWQPSTHWTLSEHRITGGDCVMPGTGHVELMASAAQATAGSAQVTLAQVEFLTPLSFPGDQPREVIVRVTPRGDGYDVSVDSTSEQDDDRVTHARAFATARVDGGEVLDLQQCAAQAPDALDVENRQSARVQFGPRWQCVADARRGDDRVLAELRLPDAFAADLEEHRVHPAMLDMAFGCAIALLADGAPGALFVPAGCEAVVVHGRVPQDARAHVVVRSYEERARLATLDVTIASASGVVVVELRGLSLLGVTGAFGSGSPTMTGDRAGASPAPPRAAPSERRIDAILSRGITAPEGMPALERALASGLPRVVVSSLDVRRVADWLSLPPASARPVGASGPEREASQDTPRDDVERALVDAYEQLLGVDAPGLDEDFFELGGHSLLAVRLFARIHKEFSLDLELSTLLAAGTVRKLAQVVREELGLPEPDENAAARPVVARMGKHVVPIQTDGERPALFLVHGAGGNVLGFRDLSHYFGKDQPLYGLQARGVDGKQPPHGTILEMAQAYVDELVELQPHGPYYVGGYSGGGVIAYEMAQILTARGEQVPFIGMIDSWCPQMPQRSKLGRALLHVGRLAKRGPMYPLRILRTKMQRWSAARDTERAREEGDVLPQDKRGFEVQFAFENAFVLHRVKPYAGDVWLFRAEDQQHGTRYVVDEQLGWQPFVHGDLQVRTCPGNHFTMCTEPNVQELCEHMMRAMDAAIAGLAAAPQPSSNGVAQPQG